MPMIRKQVYLTEAEDAKLKRLTLSRGCSAAELLREAISLLAEPDNELALWLRSRDLLVERPGRPTMSKSERTSLQARIDLSLAQSGTPPRLAEAILEERSNDDPYR